MSRRGTNNARLPMDTIMDLTGGGNPELVRRFELEAEGGAARKRARMVFAESHPVVASPPSPPATPPLPPKHAPLVGLRDLPEAAVQQLFDLTAASVSDEPWSRKRALGFIFRSSGAPVPRPEYVARLRASERCFSRDFGAHALAAVTPALAEIYRRTCVSTLVVDAVISNGEAMEMPEVKVADAFKRFPAADALVLNNLARTEYCNLSLIRLVSDTSVLQCTRLILRRMSLRVGDVDAIQHAFPNLAELVLIKCNFTDTDVALICWRLGPRLKRFRVLGAKGSNMPHNHAPSPRLVSDAGCVGLRSMPSLEVLCLDRQTSLTSRSFGQLAMLRNLRSLNLDYTKFNDLDAAMLSTLTNLMNLSVSACEELTYRMLEHLPPNLETLNISQTVVVTELTPHDVFAKSPPVITKRLVTLQADQMNFRSWAPLRNIFSLRQVYMRKCQVTAEGAKETFETWPELRRLDVSGCANFGSSGPAPHNLIFQREENPRGEMAVEALAYVAKHVKELRVDNINFGNQQWVAVVAKVMDSGSSLGQSMTLLTMNDPELADDMCWRSKLVASSIPLLLCRAFPRATLRYKVNSHAPRHHHDI